ncbi:MAG: hypothetical protein IPK20_21185, partial [Betaproteobacteria bacterium]|nr:hypothetical protein [Betaproteobacteria bacterium]
EEKADVDGEGTRRWENGGAPWVVVARGCALSTLDETLAALYVGAVIVAVHTGCTSMALQAAFMAAAAAYGRIKSPR